jgi:hypothetical protein
VRAVSKKRKQKWEDRPAPHMRAALGGSFPKRRALLPRPPPAPHSQMACILGPKGSIATNQQGDRERGREKNED